MRGRRLLTIAILLIALLALLALAACQPPPAAVNTPVPPTATPTPKAPPLPDPKADPQAALQYASQSDLVQSMGFTMAMSMTIQPADEAAAAALGGVVATALQAADVSASGNGQVEVTDRAAGKANMQMSLDVDAAGQKMKIETIVLGDKAWTRAGDGQWKQSDVENARSTVPGGMDPMGMEGLLKDAIDVQYVAEEVRDGQPVHHLRFTLDPKTADLGATLGATGMAGDEMDQVLQDAKIDVDTWLGASDLLPRYQDMRMNFVLPGKAMGVGDANLRMLMDITMAFTDVNKPVTIEAPATQ